MPLSKQALTINFSQGLDLKTDPFQVQPGKFLTLENSIFQKGGLLQKRNGYGPLATLSSTATYLTTFNNNLTAMGDSFQAYSQSTNSWVNKGVTKPVQMSTLALVRSNTNQSYADIAIAENDLICTVYTDDIPSGGSTAPSYKYVIANATTGQNIIAPTVIPVSAGIVQYAPKVFALGKYFVIVFNNYINPTNHLSYIAINSANPSQVTSIVSISTQYVPHATGAFDGCIANNTLYLAWNTGTSVRAARLTSTLTLSSSAVVAAHSATIMSVTADISMPLPILYASFYDSGTMDGYTCSFDSSLNALFAAQAIITSEDVANITATANAGSTQIYYEVNNSYTYDSGIATNYIKTINVLQAGAVGSASTLVRSVGLASKAFLIDELPYFLAVYSSDFQPSYFLINSTGKVTATLAYSNGSGYYATGLPNVSLVSQSSSMGAGVKIPYLIKDQISAVNKAQAAANANPIYSQLGINLATFILGDTVSSSAEIGGNLNVQGGFLLAYDGYSVVENGFFVWPDYVETTVINSGGSMSAQQYYYAATYEWADNQGNIFRSAPSIPVGALTTMGSSSVTIDVPTLRLTYKTSNPVKIVLYRWSTAQQIYYQVSSINVPTLNNLAVDYVTITDTSADASILGNSILYTTGGVVENISPPASDNVAMFQSRLFLIDAEDKNLLWFSKQVIESTPVEMSDLLTLYVAPTTSAQGSTGPLTALSALDDKLILFKKDAIYYITGAGPDNTGANSQFSEPIFVTATVGCDNQQSIVFTPNGLIFQSDKGMWLLGRNLETSYIGAPVESLTQDAIVQSAVNVPATNQVRFTLDSGITLMYDYYYGQWGTFTNVPAISSTLYQGLHTYIDSSGEVFQETPGLYLDNSRPVLMSFTTSWLNLAGLQGYERAYFFYLLGTYITPHKLAVSLAYDYNPSPTQVTTIAPTNFSASWGDLAQWGSSPGWGGSYNLEQWRVFLKQQKCQAFQISIQESYDPSFGIPAGAGFTLSGLDILVGVKSGYPRVRAAQSVG